MNHVEVDIVMIMSSSTFRVCHISMCRKATSGSVWYIRRVVSLSRTFQRVVLEAVCGTDGGSCHFHSTALAVLCDAGVCLCFFPSINVVYLSIYTKLGLMVGMTKQMSDGKEVDIMNC